MAAKRLWHIGPGAWLALALAAAPTPAMAADLPRPPCEAPPEPHYPSTAGGRANALVMQVNDAAPSWAPPACTGWAPAGAHGYHTLVALAGRFRLAAGQGPEAILHRLGAISSMRQLRFWSERAGDWRPFATEATALSAPDPAARRADFTAAELESGQPLHFLQRSNRLSGEVIYRMRVARLGPDRLLVHTENVTPVRFLLVTLFQPGALQSLQVAERLSATDWGFYILSRSTEAGTSPLASGHSAAYLNRADAVFRLAAGQF